MDSTKSTPTASSPCLSPSPQSCTTPDHDDFFYQVFTNDLLTDNIFATLNHAELKNLSTVNKLLLTKIRSDSNYQNLTKLRIGLPCDARPAALAPDSNLTFKTVQLTLFKNKPPNNSQNAELVKTALKDVESLELYSTPVQQTQTLAVFYAEPRAEHLHLYELLSPPNNLASLTIDYETLRDNAEKSEELRGIFSHLHELHLVIKNQFVYESEHLITRRMSSTANVANLLPTSTSTSSTETEAPPPRPPPPMYLKIFSWLGIPLVLSSNPAIPIRNYPFEIMQLNQQTLTILNLTLRLEKPNIWEGLKEIYCPCLKTLNVEADFYYRDDNRFGANLNEFLKNHQHLLERFSLKCDALPLKILETISGGMGRTLKNLSLKVSALVNDFDSPALPSPWISFWLNRMIALEEFESQSLHNNWHPGTEFEDIFPHIPPALKKLTLEFFPSESWRGNTCWLLGPPELIGQGAAGIGANAYLNLTELNISARREPFSTGESRSLKDEFFTYIFESFTRLKKLSISNCRSLTGVGLIGTDEAQPQPSIQNLRDLEKLTLWNCPNLSDESVKLALKFPKLVYLCLVSKYPLGIHSFDVESLQKVAVQNPRLETMVVNSPEKNIGNALKAANPGITRVININDTKLRPQAFRGQPFPQY